MREGWDTPYPPRFAHTTPGETWGSSLCRRGLVGSPFVEGGSLAHPTTTARRPERALRVLRKGEALHVRGGRGEIRYVLRVVCNVRMTDYLSRTTRYSALHANAPAFKIPETDIFDENDPSPSSLPTSSRSTPSSQLSTTSIDASRCGSRDVANVRSRAQCAREGEGGDERGEGCTKGDLRHPLHSRLQL